MYLWTGFHPDDYRESRRTMLLHSLTLLGPSLLFAAFTGVLLFA